MPFGSAQTALPDDPYRPTVTPEGSTHVDTAFTGTTSSFSGTATGKVAMVAVVRQRIIAVTPQLDAHNSAFRCVSWAEMTWAR
ncbi:hypothetical protein GCM10027167_39470 [Nocardia heshunensis]